MKSQKHYFWKDSESETKKERDRTRLRGMTQILLERKFNGPAIQTRPLMFNNGAGLLRNS